MSESAVPVTPTIRIAGWGLATPLGVDAPQTWDRLLEGRFITDHALVPIPRDPMQARVSQLAAIVARESLAAAGWLDIEVRGDERETRAGRPCHEMALVIGTSKGPIEQWLSPGGLVHPAGLGQIATDLAAGLRLAGLRLGDGPRLTVSAACASGLHALIRAIMLLQSGDAKRALVVAVESSLHPLFLASFQRLGVLAKQDAGCRPFDRQRGGFLMSEAAAAVCLEAVYESPSGVPLSSHPSIYVDGFALGGAAGHLTAGDGDGALLRRLLNRVIGGRPVDLFHAHATGTVLNDPIELAAIEDAVESTRRPNPAEPPELYSHKGALGHSLGAAGLVAIVLNCQMHQQGRVPPIARLNDPLPVRHVHLPRAIVVRPIRRSVAAASGFGGPTAVVSLSS